MTCEEALVLISGHLDNENTTEEEMQLHAHLEHCAQCRQVLEAFREIDTDIADLTEEVPAGLREDVMAAIRREAAPKKKKKQIRWAPVAAAAALVLVIGASAMHMPSFRAEQETAAPMMARSMPAEAALMDTSVEAAAAAEIDLQELADDLQADVAVTFELLPELEVCPCETLDSGFLLYRLESADAAVELSRRYGIELYQPAVYGDAAAYVLLLPEN